MDRKEAILRIKDHMEHHGIGKYPHLKLKEALDMAIAALSQQNEPMTLEQLREMDGDPVYVVPKDKPAHCGGWCGVTVRKCDRYSYVSLLRDADSGWGFEEYGKTWIAYRLPPE